MVSPFMIRAGLIFGLLLFLWIQSASGAISVVTQAATGVTTDTATISGVLSGLTRPSAVVYLEYSSKSGIYNFKTPNQTVTANGTFTAILSGAPLVEKKTYYYRAVAKDGLTTAKGAQFSFTTGTVTAITGYDFDAHFDELIADDLNISSMAATSAKPYTDIVGAIFYGIVFGLIFLMMWLRQEDITVPSIVGLLIGGSIWSLMPPDWRPVAYSLMIVSFGGLMYSIIKGRS